MESRETIKTILVENSPIEFVLIGPNPVAKGVIAKSKNASIDLIGASASSNFYDEIYIERSTLSLVSRLFLIENTYGVRSSMLKNITPRSKRSRRSEYEFFWRGFAQDRELEKIKIELRESATDIFLSLKEKNSSAFDWHISRIVKLCYDANRKSKMRRAYSIFTAGIVAILYIVIVITYFFRDIFSSNSGF